MRSLLLALCALLCSPAWAFYAGSGHDVTPARGVGLSFQFVPGAAANPTQWGVPQPSTPEFRAFLDKQISLPYGRSAVARVWGTLSPAAIGRALARTGGIVGGAAIAGDLLDGVFRQACVRIAGGVWNGTDTPWEKCKTKPEGQWCAYGGNGAKFCSGDMASAFSAWFADAFPTVVQASPPNTFTSTLVDPVCVANPTGSGGSCTGIRRYCAAVTYGCQNLGVSRQLEKVTVQVPDGYGPATPADVAPAIAAPFSTPSAAPDVKRLLDEGLDVEVTEPKPQVEPVAPVEGPTVTRRFADPQTGDIIEEQTKTWYKPKIAGDTIDFDEVETVTRTNTRTGETQTTGETITTDPTAGGTSSEPIEVPDLCELHPEASACQKLGEAQGEDPSWTERVIDFAPESVGLASGCPPDWQASIRGWDLRMSYRPACDAAGLIRPLIVAMSSLAALIWILSSIRGAK